MTPCAISVAGATASMVIYVSQVRLESASAVAKHPHGCSRVLRDARASDTFLNPSSLRDEIIAGCLLGTGKLPAADRTMAATVAREPQNVFVWLAYANYLAARHRPATARAAYAHARSLDPHLPPFGS
jgi:predicted Zn-dependent protease